MDRASRLTLSAPELTILIAGHRVLTGPNGTGVLTARVSTLTNDFFVNLSDMGTTWQASPTDHVRAGRARATRTQRKTASAFDLLFGSNSHLRALAEVYGSRDGQEKIERDFIASWYAIMTLDHSDLH